MTVGFPIPDDILKKAYLKAAKEAGCYREKFISRTSCVERVRELLGPPYAHISIDDLRDRIITCCKNPDKHGGGWSGSIGHGPSSSDSRLKKLSKEYLEYLQSSKWKKFVCKLRAFWGNHCAICNSPHEPLMGHHRTYKNLGREELNDCILVCEACHRQCDKRRHAEKKRQNSRR